MNLVLDIGNVICRWSPDVLVARVFEAADDRAAALHHIVGHEDWLALDRGVMSVEEAARRCAMRCDLDPASILEVYTSTPGSLVPFQQMVAAIRMAAAAGMPLFVCSNMQSHCWDHLRRSYDFWSCFRGIVVSCEVRLLKPEHQMYAHLCDRFALEPADTVFLDDMPENVAAAQAFGLDGVLVTGPEDAALRIRRLVG